MKFTKMQGIGNDYVYVNCFEEKVEDPSALAIQVSDRHFGIGSDGLILICPSEVADCEMAMYNADGSRGEMCGNGVRCVGKYMYDYGLTDKTEITVETLAGIKTLQLFVENMGYPHAVVYVDDVDNLPIEEIGPKFESHERFPRRVNTEFVKVLDRHTVQMRVWERGSAETLACGTGACAVAVSCILNGLTEDEVTVKLLGGDLEIQWDQEKNTVYMTGPATVVFDGELK